MIVDLVVHVRGAELDCACDVAQMPSRFHDMPTTTTRWHAAPVKLSVETEKEVDGRWIAAIDPVGALAYGATKAEAVRKAKAIALEVLADRLNAGESG